MNRTLLTSILILLCTITMMAQECVYVDIYGAYNLSGVKSQTVGHCIALLPKTWVESNEYKQLSQRVEQLEAEYLRRARYNENVERLHKTKANLEAFMAQKAGYAEDVYAQVIKEASAAIALMEKEIADNKPGDASDAKDIVAQLQNKSLGGKLYSSAEYIGRGVYLVNDISTDKSLSWGCVSDNGMVILPCKYHIQRTMCTEEHNRICVFDENEKYGIFDYNGKQIIPQQYNLLDIVGKYLVAYRDGKWGIMDMNGKSVYPFTASKIEMWRFNEGIPDTWVYMIYNENKKMAFFDKDMQQKTSFKYSSWTQNDPIVMGCGPDNGVVDTFNVSNF